MYIEDVEDNQVESEKTPEMPSLDNFYKETDENFELVDIEREAFSSDKVRQKILDSDVYKTVER